MRLLFTLLSLLLLSWGTMAQTTNILLTNPVADDVLKGNFNPADYAPSNPIMAPDAIVQGLIDDISSDSLKTYLEVMSTFETRNTGADTSSATTGMGAARNWALAKFEDFSSRQEDRLVVSFLQFDRDICNMGRHKNTLAVLPGQGPHYDEVVLVEGHLDSRCEDGCDTDCIAHGMEDNGSGSALVLELARVMSRFAFDRTIVFMLTTGEEQGLLGADAFGAYCDNEDIKLKAVYNNDIIGGVICGATASPPGCPGLNEVDSINVRLYSAAGSSKQLARFSKLEYGEMVAPNVTISHTLNIMNQEDRTGRGGDHIPFRERGYPAIRFTSANEHGDGNPSQSGYMDRQHTVEDLLGVDTDGDMVLDSFFVDFNYLARNAIMNGNAIAMTAIGPPAPFDLQVVELDNALEVSFQDTANTGMYRIFLRNLLGNSSGQEFGGEIATSQTLDTIALDSSGIYRVSVCSVNEDGVESLFTEEVQKLILVANEDLSIPVTKVELLQNRPNPFDEVTTLGVYVMEPFPHQKAWISVHDLSGKALARLPIVLNRGLNEVVYGYHHHGFQPGTYAYSLWVDGKRLATKRMIYAY